MGQDESEEAKTLYRKLLALFPNRSSGARISGKVVPFPTTELGAELAKTHEASLSRRPGSAPSIPGSRDQEQSRGIEGLLKRLFEELAKDD